MAAPARKRVTLEGEGGSPWVSVWVHVAESEGGRVTITLLHDYPDLAPAAGWRARGRGLSCRVRRVEGRVLTCDPVTEGGAA